MVRNLANVSLDISILRLKCLLALLQCTYHLTYVHTSLYTSGFFLRSSNQLCLGRLAYRGYLFGLDESVTEKAKRRFAVRMSLIMRSGMLCRVGSVGT